MRDMTDYILNFKLQILNVFFQVAGVKIPRLLAKFITSCQFLQMVVNMVVNTVSAYYYRKI
jgi:hypothetical protein